MRLMSRLDARLKRWHFVALMAIGMYAVAVGVMWWSYPATPTERQVGSRAFSAFVFLPMVMLMALVVWGVASLVAKRVDKRQRT
jgi:hypothetical protein